MVDELIPADGIYGFGEPQVHLFFTWRKNSEDESGRMFGHYDLLVPSTKYIANTMVLNKLVAG